MFKLILYWPGSLRTSGGCSTLRDSATATRASSRTRIRLEALPQCTMRLSKIVRGWTPQQTAVACTYTERIIDYMCSHKDRICLAGPYGGHFMISCAHITGKIFSICAFGEGRGEYTRSAASRRTLRGDAESEAHTEQPLQSFGAQRQAPFPAGVLPATGFCDGHCGPRLEPESAWEHSRSVQRDCLR